MTPCLSLCLLMLWDTRIKMISRYTSMLLFITIVKQIFENRCFLKIEIINNIQDFYNELMYCLTVIFLCVIKVITCIPSLIYQDADRDYESISSGDELPNMDEIDPELQVCIHCFY